MGIKMNTYNYGFISRVLANNTDKLWTDNKERQQLPDHENLQGEDYSKNMCND